MGRVKGFNGERFYEACLADVRPGEYVMVEIQQDPEDFHRFREEVSRYNRAAFRHLRRCQCKLGRVDGYDSVFVKLASLPPIPPEWYKEVRQQLRDDGLPCGPGSINMVITRRHDESLKLKRIFLAEELNAIMEHKPEGKWSSQWAEMKLGDTLEFEVTAKEADALAASYRAFGKQKNWTFKRETKRLGNGKIHVKVTLVEDMELI